MAVILTAIALVPSAAHVFELANKLALPQLPGNWHSLRMRWEFGHAAGAALMFIALCAAALHQE